MKIPQAYTIALACKHDLPFLAAIECAAATVFPTASIPDEMRSDSVPLDVLKEACKNRMLWVVKNSLANPVGYALIMFVENHALLAQMDVHPDHARKGLGTALVNTLVHYLRTQKINALYLTTFRHIPWNAPFYARLGFSELDKAERPGFIGKILEEEVAAGLQGRVAMRLIVHDKD